MIGTQGNLEHYLDSLLKVSQDEWIMLASDEDGLCSYVIVSYDKEQNEYEFAQGGRPGSTEYAFEEIAKIWAEAKNTNPVVMEVDYLYTIVYIPNAPEEKLFLIGSYWTMPTIDDPMVKKSALMEYVISKKPRTSEQAEAYEKEWLEMDKERRKEPGLAGQEGSGKERLPRRAQQGGSPGMAQDI
ncbi:MAG: hypothetical protein GF344_11940 [Chitinivibrionales bacterium]|nr:hypothetical protein [Chitinivibrionales bacterium]